MKVPIKVSLRFTFILQSSVVLVLFAALYYLLTFYNYKTFRSGKKRNKNQAFESKVVNATSNNSERCNRFQEITVHYALSSLGWIWCFANSEKLYQEKKK